VLDAYDPRSQRWFSRRYSSPLNTYTTIAGGRMMDFTRGAVADARGRYRARFDLHAAIGEVMFSIYAPVGMATDEPRTVGLDRNSLLLRDLSSERAASWSYELLVQPAPDADTLVDLCAGARRPDDGRAGFPVAEIRPIAEEILAEVVRTSNVTPALAEGAGDDERWTRNREVARAIASWMKSKFTYTTDLSSFGRVPGEDPIVSFLTRYKSGHCEYFASALCAVLRSLGIEARIVTGFIAMEYDDQSRSYIVRESNAHAWVEVRTGDLAWTAVDATPEESLFAIQERNRSFADRFRWLYVRLESLWNSGVVAYDSSSQQSFATNVESRWREAVTARLEDLLGRLKVLTTVLSLGRAGAFWFAAIGIAVGTALLAWLIVVLRRRRLRTALHIERLPAHEQARIRRDAAFYVEALRALSQAGHEKPAHLSPRAFADQLAVTNVAAGAALHDISDAFYKVRYGGRQPSQGEANAHLSKVSALRAALRQNSRSPRVD
jgi:transglutaminase-like putative cysteine protease